MMIQLRKLYIRIYDALKNDIIYILGNYGLRIASFVFTIIVARKIAPENYGLFGLATLIITYVTYFNLGSQYSINKELSIDRNNQKVNIYGLLNTIIFSSIVLIFALTSISIGLFADLKPYYYYLILYPILFNILEISNGILRAHEKSKQLGIIKLSGALFVVIVTIYYLIEEVPDDPSPLFSRFLLFQAVEVIVSLFFLRKVISLKSMNLRKSIDPKYLKYLVIQGIVLSLYITIDSFTKSIDRLFIATFYSKADLGYYSFGVSLQGPFLLGISSIIYMDYSRILKKLKSATLNQFLSSVQEVYKKLLLIWILTLLGAAVISFLLLRFFIPNYYASYFVVIIYIFNYVMRIFIFPYTSYLIANDYKMDIIKAILIPTVLNTIFSFIVVKLKLPYYFILMVTLPSNIIYFFILRRLLKRKYIASYEFEEVPNVKTIADKSDI